MQNNDSCLQEAMIIASESYSGSTYETHLFEPMHTDCVSAFMFRAEDYAMNTTPMAA